MALVKNITGSVHNEPTANYLEHDDHVALVENVAGRVHCDPREVLDFLGIPRINEC